MPKSDKEREDREKRKANLRWYENDPNLETKVLVILCIIAVILLVREFTDIL